jgi:addiction module RelE/StbE family toxin
MYSVEYLPKAMQDMTEIVNYIGHELDNAEAAEKLAVELIESADRLIDFPYANPVYHAKKPLKQEYRKLKVHNYIMFYRVDELEKRITIARVIYSRRDYENML